MSPEAKSVHTNIIKQPIAFFKDELLNAIGIKRSQNGGQGPNRVVNSPGQDPFRVSPELSPELTRIEARRREDDRAKLELDTRGQANPADFVIGAVILALEWAKSKIP